ncbi:winged helix-turn-helix transcriptional regulator [Sphingomonas glacialis]|nr:helix-turn-helix domain-containing protein [Sphingomonas glacialis]
MPDAGAAAGQRQGSTVYNLGTPLEYETASTPLAAPTRAEIALLDIFARRWTMLAVRILLAGPLRFGGLFDQLPGISRNVLTQRLLELQSVGMIRKRRVPPSGRVQVYELTEWGHRGVAMFQALAGWADRGDAALTEGVVSPQHDPG